MLKPCVLGAILAEGKTKKVQAVKDEPELAGLVAKDDITAGDGARHDIIPGKSELATATTSNVFRLLRDCGVPVAFKEQVDRVTFTASLCDMQPYEVVVRRQAYGSFVKRHPGLERGTAFPKLVVEFYLKTKNREWGGYPLPVDDPLIQFRGSQLLLYRPDQPVKAQESFLTLSNIPHAYLEVFDRMSQHAQQAFLALEKAWQMQNCTLADLKVEFGFDPAGELVLADVVDNDSWRVTDQSGAHLDKQLYRDGAPLNQIKETYEKVAELTGRFALPRQQVVLWRASERDDIGPISDALKPYLAKELDGVRITCSAHKEPVRAYEELNLRVGAASDSVVIVWCGKSNGAGPVVAANTTAPVITIPATAGEFPDDVWSSLRMPGGVPVMTVLDPGNAVLAALQILAMRNPRLYAKLRYEQEKRLTNIF